MIEQICPILGTDAIVEGGDIFRINSSYTGGKFQLSSELYDDLMDNGPAYTKGHPRLNAIKISSHILQQNIRGLPPRFLSYEELEKLSQQSYLSINERFNLILKTIRWKFPEIGHEFFWEKVNELIPASNTPYTFENKTKSYKFDFCLPSLSTFLQKALKENLLDISEIVHGHPSKVYLTLEGHQYIESLGHQLSDSDQIFVAMWFNDTTRQLYEAAIKPAIEQAGYKVMRIDDKSHNEKICDEIIAEIRKSKAIIADMTCGLAKPESWSAEDIVGAPRGGVFYEAGFAHGLGIPVIWTVNQEIADIENVSHFDVRQYNQIRWTEENLEEAKKEILNRIEATLGQGPHLEQK